MSDLTYTSDQIQQYYHHIDLPSQYHFTQSTIQSQPLEQQLIFLNTLLRHQLVKVPFESLDLHYSVEKCINISPIFLFQKIVSRNSGRGGYCMQNNAFFATILRSLGFAVSSHGGRICLQFLQETPPSASGEESFIGWAHQVNIIHLSGQRYFCDVGFGSAGPTSLVPLQDGYTAINTGDEHRVATTMKLHLGWVAGTAVRSEDSKQWIYSVKYGADDQDAKTTVEAKGQSQAVNGEKVDKTKAHWIQCYAFSKNEFLPADFEVMSWHVSTEPSSMFVNNVLCQKHIMSDDGERLIGDVTLFGKDIKERKYGVSERLMEIRTEDDRLEALEKFLDVKLSDLEKAGIIGSKAEIKSEV